MAQQLQRAAAMAGLEVAPGPGPLTADVHRYPQAVAQPESELTQLSGGAGHRNCMSRGGPRPSEWERAPGAITH